MKTRIKLESHEKCERCGELLPAGMTAYILSGNDGTGYLHYGKCRGTARIEREAQKLDLKNTSTEKLLNSLITSAPGAQELIIAELIERENNKKLELLKAEHQLTGFAHAAQGFDVISLIESMALRQEEWGQLRDETWITENMRTEIDEHFEGSA
jgi:hypothetical protein